MILEEIKEWIATAQSITGFTGAGISTESGIPDFRSPNGVWAKNRTVYFQEFLQNTTDRIEYWRQKAEIWPSIRDAHPNLGHRAFVSLAKQEKLISLITQNIDGLHQRSGLDPKLVLELHGTTTEAKCLNCSNKITMNEAVNRIRQGETDPKCYICLGLLKPSTISFGQSLSTKILEKARQATQSCEIFLAVGSSLVVEPAASLPVLAKEFGAKLVIINRTETPIDRLADSVIRGEITKILPQLVSKKSSDLKRVYS